MQTPVTDFRPIFIVGTSLILGACTHGHQGPQAQAPRSRTIVEGPMGRRLDSLMSRYEEYGFSGAVLVARGGTVVLSKGYGFADRQHQVRATPATLYDFGSITKTVVGAAALRLEADGLALPQDRISRFVGPLPGAKDEMTIRHLATHTSGLPAGSRSSATPDREAFLELVRGQELLSPPGSAYRYSNWGASLLSAITEIATRRPFADYVRQEVFRRGGIDAGFRWEPHWDSVRARGYRRSPTQPNGEATEIPMYWGVRGATGLIATVPDVYAWQRSLITGRILPPAQTARLRDSTIEEAYGWHWEPAGRAGTPRWHKGGDYPGFKSQVMVYPTRGVEIVWASNDETRPWRYLMNEGLTRIAFGEDSAFVPPAVLATDSAALAAITGRYVDASSGKPVEIKSWDGGIYFASGDSLPPDAMYFRTGASAFTGLAASSLTPFRLDIERADGGVVTAITWSAGRGRRRWQR